MPAGGRWSRAKEPLASAAYYIFTRVRHAPFAGSLEQAAASLNVAQRVLRKLSELSSRSDPEHGRKVERTNNPLTDPELAWLRAVLPVLIHRVLEYEAGGRGGLAQITMDQLPPLP